jgi:hypothetical protein
LRIPRKLQIFFCDDGCRTTNLHVGAV